MQERYPGIGWKDVRDLVHHKDSERVAQLMARKRASEYRDHDPHEGYFSKKELCNQIGLTPAEMFLLEKIRLLTPDTKDRRYRPSLVGWGKKLKHLLEEGWEPEEIKAWAKGRWHKKDPCQWPPNRDDWALKRMGR